MAKDATKDGDKRGAAVRIDPRDRAADGLRRYKVRLDGYDGYRGQVYYLAADAAAAQAAFVQEYGVPAAAITPPKAGDPPPCRFVVTALDD